MLSREDYKAIADIIKENLQIEYCGYIGYASGLADSLCNELADYFESDNPRFDRQRFLNACFN